ncbi:hypothetical protein FRB94_011171 [Tulasnella sp. JGI-2019a]|nr:hypothetical protein FRB93_009909 [Tulasnella sp. JGI-2019a]KAG8992933.1 hypothetical protein FRB94_011171 [Tulasnella sp. JGI-2019a]
MLELKSVTDFEDVQWWKLCNLLVSSPNLEELTLSDLPALNESAGENLSVLEFHTFDRLATVNLITSSDSPGEFHSILLSALTAPNLASLTLVVNRPKIALENSFPEELLAKYMLSVEYLELDPMRGSEEALRTFLVAGPPRLTSLALGGAKGAYNVSPDTVDTLALCTSLKHLSLKSKMMDNHTIGDMTKGNKSEELP